MSRLTRALGLSREAIEHVEEAIAEREIGVPLEGTNMSLFQSQIPNWWSENMNAGLLYPAGGYLAERVWVANRCIQMNSQQIASMPLRYEGNYEPAWCSNPDPMWFPNGISDVILSIVADIYGWGFSCLYITDTYATGYPRTWMPLPSRRMFISREGFNGARVYSLGGETLDPRRVVQIDRNPDAWRLHGTPALAAYGQQAFGLIAAGEMTLSVSQGGIPTAVLKADQELTASEADKLKNQWMTSVMSRNGAPAVLGEGLDFQVLSFNPQELGLLELQDFNAKAVATAFGVPAVLLNMAIRWGMTYANVGMLGEMWWRFELRPTAKRIADALSSQMLPSGQWVWFDAADTFLPLDTPDTGPFATIEDDPQAAALAKDMGQSAPPASATASPVNGSGNPLNIPAMSGVGEGGTQ